ncbi:hypothetical protein EJ02DRAFT_470970 [Clathrospora elynae]|uniref:Uncharacterized protein n=1 Tax=Clathrospora elynae TaxID=706981 RepID=A0A6A5S8G5_9PLEO|nr:hypothetical protein EJ02DRAFT_470970 [Clathrospora elynae]
MYHFAFKTTYDTEPSIIDSGDDRRLLLKGIVVDKVAKAIFFTEKGYLGLGLITTIPGDEVCVLYGGRTPFVVQKVKRDVNCPGWLDVEEEMTTTSVEKFKALIKNLVPFWKEKTEECKSEMPPATNTDADASLRRKDCYRFVGESYVEALMGGEAMELREMANGRSRATKSGEGTEL